MPRVVPPTSPRPSRDADCRQSSRTCSSASGIATAEPSSRTRTSAFAASAATADCSRDSLAASSSRSRIWPPVSPPARLAAAAASFSQPESTAFSARSIDRSRVSRWTSSRSISSSRTCRRISSSSALAASSSSIAFSWFSLACFPLLSSSLSSACFIRFRAASSRFPVRRARAASSSPCGSFEPDAPAPSVCSSPSSPALPPASPSPAPGEDSLPEDSLPEDGFRESSRLAKPSISSVSPRVSSASLACLSASGPGGAPDSVEPSMSRCRAMILASFARCRFTSSFVFDNRRSESPDSSSSRSSRMFSIAAPWAAPALISCPSWRSPTMFASLESMSRSFDRSNAVLRRPARRGSLVASRSASRRSDRSRSRNCVVSDS